MKSYAEVLSILVTGTAALEKESMGPFIWVWCTVNYNQGFRSISLPKSVDLANNSCCFSPNGYGKKVMCLVSGKRP